MKVLARKSKRWSQRGVALVLAIFTLMLISVIATTLIVTAGTASAIRANYKSSMEAFYDAKAGLEEGRSRLWPGNVACLTNATSCNPAPPANCIFGAGNTVPVNQVCYIVNPDPTTGETVDPIDSNNPYFDAEWATEFPGQTHNFSIVNSNSPVSSSIAGPPYKWVRITPRTQVSSGVNIDGSPNPTDPTDPLYYGFYDANSSGTCQPGTTGESPAQFVWNGVGTPRCASQVFTVTALAVTPFGGFSGKRLLQYTVAQNPNPLGQALTPPGTTVPPTLNQIFKAALTLDGNGVTYSGNVAIQGQDSSVCTSQPCGTGVQAIAYTNSSDPPPACGTNCQAPTGTPAVGTVTLPPLMQTLAGLNGLVDAITQDASVVINPPSGTTSDQTALPAAMTATYPRNSGPPATPSCTPMIVVVNGDFHLTHPGGANAVLGCGLLLVTGTLTYDPDDSWFGLILVIGKGVINGSETGSGGKINGAVVVAKTRDNSGNPLSTLGASSVNLTGGGSGIRYASNWVNSLQSMMPYQVLSFREIQQQ
jgi:Tfp pilus assembly protein PilX